MRLKQAVPDRITGTEEQATIGREQTSLQDGTFQKTSRNSAEGQHHEGEKGRENYSKLK